MPDTRLRAEIPVTELLKDDPKNWGRWGPDDEVGSLNFLTQAEVLRGVQAVRQGKTFTLQVMMATQRAIRSGRGGRSRCIST